MEWFRSLFRREPPNNASSLFLAGDGEFQFEVVGESKYQGALSGICGGQCEDGHQSRTLSRLFILPCSLSREPPDAAPSCLDANPVCSRPVEGLRESGIATEEMRRGAETILLRALLLTCR